MNKYIKFAITPLLLLPIFSVAHSAAQITQLSAQPIHSVTIREIVQSLSKRHYNKIEINDALSSNLLDSYIDNLDPSRSYFYSADIKEFETLRHRLDDEIKNASVASGFLL